MDCLYRDDELPGDGSVPKGAVIVETFRGKFGLHPERLAAKREGVAAIVRRLKPEFLRTGEGAGGGYTFLALPMFADGEHWAEHQTCDELLALVFGLGMGAFCSTRETWRALPGGMPYLWLDPDAGGAKAA